MKEDDKRNVSNDERFAAKFNSPDEDLTPILGGEVNPAALYILAMLIPGVSALTAGFDCTVRVEFDAKLKSSSGFSMTGAAVGGLDGSGLGGVCWYGATAAAGLLKP